NVRYQLAFSLGAFSGDKRNQALTQLVLRDPGVAAMRLAVMTSLSDGAGQVMAELAELIHDQPTLGGGICDFLKILATQIGTQSRAADVMVFEQQLASLT